MMTSPSFGKATASVISACVPTASGAPAAMSASAYAFARPVSLPASHTGGRPSGVSQRVKLR